MSIYAVIGKQASGDTKSVRAMRLAAIKFHVPYGQLRYIGQIPDRKAWVVACERCNVVDRHHLAGLEELSPFAKAIQLVRIAELENLQLGVRALVMAGQCLSCGKVAVGEHIIQMDALIL